MIKSSLTNGINSQNLVKEICIYIYIIDKICCKKCNTDIISKVLQQLILPSEEKKREGGYRGKGLSTRI